MNTLVTQNYMNLLDLWRCYGAVEKDGLWFSKGWPYRVWHDSLDHKLTFQTLSGIQLNENQQVVTLQKTNLVCTKNENELRADANLTLMHLSISQATIPLVPHSRLELLNRDDIAGIRAFMHLCSEGFGYSLELASLCRAAKQKGVKLGFLQVNNERVATILLFRQGQSLGVFQLTVPPKYRGKKYATHIMLHTINWAKKQGLSAITLQASEMGLALYQRLGFESSGAITFWRQ